MTGAVCTTFCHCRMILSMRNHHCSIILKAKGTYACSFLNFIVSSIP
jgi:hypothetical protein